MPLIPHSRLALLAGSLLALPCLSSGAPVPEAAISEFVADNTDLQDADGDTPDWIEIWNASGEPGDLDGYYLTDDPALLTKWRIPAATFNGEGYALVFASGKDRTDPAAELHTNFGLDADGGYLALVKPDGVTIATEFVDYPNQFEDVGFGTGFGEPQPITLVDEGATARWLVPEGEIPGWQDVGFVDDAWTTATTGIGYDTGTSYDPLIGAGGDTQDAMRSVNASVFIRVPFNVDQPAGISSLTLRMKWEDGFIAYLNGAEIHRERAPAGAVAWNATADSNRSPESLVFEFDDYAVSGSLVPGENILAIHGLNASQGSSDFIIVPAMTASQQDISNPQTGFFIEPTPGSPNGTLVEGLVADTQFSLDRGFYTAAFDLIISTATPDAEIRYTTDGTAPSPTEGQIYSGPITIDTTTVIRAMAHRAGYEPTNIDTHTYVFPASVYGAGFEQALTSVPTISVVTEHTAFLNENGANDYNEYQTSFEMIYPDGREGVQEDAGMGNFGGRFTNFRKKSFRVSFKREFGAPKLRHPIFDDFDYPNYPPAEEFDAINLRSGSHDMVNRGGYMAPRFVDDTMLEMGNIAPHGRFVHLYLNGNYWGQYHLRERWNADMASSYFGGSKDDYDAISANNSGMNFMTGTVYDGTAAFWNETRNLLTGPDPFINAANHIDIANVVDFMLLWVSGECESEFRAFGSSIQGVPFKFMMRDPDGYLPGSGWGHVHPVTHQGPINAMSELRSGGNPDYDVFLADRIHKHFFNDGALTADKSVDRLRKRVEEARPGFAAEARRWNFRSVSSWESYVNSWLNSGLPQRTPAMIAKFKAAGMYPDLIAPVYSQHGGSIAPGAGITMATNATAIYYTTDGSDPRLPGGTINPSAISAPFDGDVPVPQDFIATGQVWKYLADGSDQGTAWRESGFDDAAWPEGPSELGYREGDEATDVGFVDIDPAPGIQRNATTYFRTTVELENPSSYSNFLVRLKYDDAAAVYANGVEIVRTDNLPANASFDTYASGGTPSENTYFEYEIPSSRFVDGTNTIAAEIHNSSAGSSDISFDLFLRGEVDTENGDNITEPVVLAEPTILRARAFDANNGEWSALNEAFFSIGSVPADATNLALVEIHYHPAEPSTPGELATSTDRDDYEFAEFLNTGGSPIELSGVRFADAINFAFPDNSLLEPGERLVIVRDLDAFTARYGALPGVVIAGEYSGRFSNDGETVSVESLTTGGITTFTYNDQSPWPTLTDGGGPSLVYIGSDPTMPDAWAPHAMTGGNPGGPDSVVTGGYAAWKDANNIINDLGDPDDDGVPSLAEYAFGTAPRDFASSAPPSAGVASEGGEQHLTLSYQQNIAAIDVTITPQRSSDLETWVPAADLTVVSETDNPDGETRTIVLRAPTPIDGLEYLRLQVEINAP